MRAKIWKAVRKIYAFGILVYFAGSGVRAVRIPSFPIGSTTWAFTPFTHSAGRSPSWCESGRHLSLVDLTDVQLEALDKFTQSLTEAKQQ